MESPPVQPAEGFPKHILIRIGSAIGFFALTLIILDFMPWFFENTPSGQQIPYSILAFWIAWILVFAILDYYFVPKPTVSPLPQDIQRKNSLLLTGMIVLGVIDLVIMALIMQKWNSGSDEGILPLMIIWFVIALIVTGIALLHFISVMDARDKNRKLAEAGPMLRQPESEQDRNAR